MNHKFFRWSSGLIFVLVLSLNGVTPALAAPPANDNFVDSEVISSLPFSTTVDNTDATVESNEPQGCSFPFQSVWYSFTPAETMAVRVDMAGSIIGGSVNVFFASGPSLTDLTSVVCASSYDAANFQAEAGKTYYLRVDSFGQTGVLQLNLEQITPPANDNFANAEIVPSLPFSATVDSTNATTELSEPHGCGFPNTTIWYSFTSAENITIQVDLLGDNSAGVTAIYLASGPGISDLTYQGCAYNGSSANVQTQAGKTYYFQVTGVTQFSLREMTPPANDNFANPELIPSLPLHLVADNTKATIEAGEVSNCASQYRSLWYSFSPADNLDVRIDTFGSIAPGNVSIYLASGLSFSDLTFITCTTGGSSAKVSLQAGKTYYLQVDSYGQAGEIHVNMAETTPPANDNFTNAQIIASLPFDASVVTSDATLEVDEPEPCGGMPNSIWYTFTATETTRLRMDALGSSMSANVNVYHMTGSGFPGLQFLQCSGFGGTATFPVKAGEIYYFQASGYGLTGTIQFHLRQSPTISGRVIDAVTEAPLAGDTEPYASVDLLYICGDGCQDLLASQQTDSEGRFFFDGNYYGDPLIAGNYQIRARANLYTPIEIEPFEFTGSNLDMGDLRLNPSPIIRGRVLDSSNGNSLPGATVTVRGCSGDVCNDYVNSQSTDNDGYFKINSSLWGDPFSAGMYEVEIAATSYVTQRVKVTLGESEDRDLGDVLLVPVPLIGSISGRMVEAATGKPISLIFFPGLTLLRCEDWGCTPVGSATPDSNGYFRLETDNAGNHLTIGSYRIVGFAEQYEFAQSDTFEVGENVDLTVPDLKVNSYPVRFSGLQPCADISASGGDCIFSVTVTNGTTRNLSGKTWSLADGLLPEALSGYTRFQIKDPQDLDLAFGKSKVFRFRFNVPANPGPYGTNICTRVFVGEGSQALLNTIGFRELFCVFWDTNGFSIASHAQVVALPQRTVNLSALATEVEPNNTCQSAQDVGAFSSHFVINGELDSSAAPDVDFFRFSGTPGTLIALDLEGQSTGKGTLIDPYLGFFDSNCNLVATNDDNTSLNSHLEITIPDDGIFMLGATTCCDSGFQGGGFGSYQLTVAPIQLIGSISGVITDAVSGKPLAGDVAPYAYVRLLRCEADNCFDVNAQNAGSDGRFRFETNFYGEALRAGEYRIAVFAQQYYEMQTERFTVGESENYDTGKIALNSYPIRLGNIQTCNVPAEGGLCDFGLQITNGLPTKFSGKAWSIVDGYALGSFMDFTSFQADAPVTISLGAGKSTLLRFRFQVRGSVPDGATMCPTAFVGQNPNSLYNTVGQGILFCVVKGSNGFTLMSEQETQSQWHHKLLHPTPTSHKPSWLKK